MQTFSKSSTRTSFQTSEKKRTIAPNKFNSGTTKDYFSDISNNKINEFRLFSVSEDAVKRFCYA